MKKTVLIFLFCIIQVANLFSQVISSEKASIKFNNKTREEAAKPPETIQSKNTKAAVIKAPEIELINLNIERGKVISWDQNKINLIGKVNSFDQKIVLYLNNQEIKVNESGFFNIDHSLANGINDISLKAVSESKLINEMSFKIDCQPKPVEDLPGVQGKYYALIIGISNYDDPKFEQLDKPTKDAEEFFNTLTSKYSFEKENVKLLLNATNAEIIHALEYYEHLIRPIDNLLIFYAGHGYWDKESEIGFWIPSDASKNSKLAWFRNSTLRDYLRTIKSKHTLLISDACFGGSIFKTRSVLMDASFAISKLYDLPSRQAMTSGYLTEVPDQSVFLKYLIARLQNNFEKYLSSGQLFEKFRIAVMNNSSAVPEFGVIQDVGDEGGDFIFILRE
jgi:Na+-transporting methylmalonyl-CoA/oxaloacetate decarboxylase gamma subunit